MYVFLYGRFNLYGNETQPGGHGTKFLFFTSARALKHGQGGVVTVVAWTHASHSCGNVGGNFCFVHQAVNRGLVYQWFIRLVLHCVTY